MVRTGQTAHNWFRTNFLTYETNFLTVTTYVMQLGNEMPPAVAKKKLDKAVKKPVETLTLSKAKKIHADLFEINASVYFGHLDVAALMELYHGTDITSEAQLHEQLARIKDAIEVRFNLTSGVGDRK
jgi:hypothetical protein